MSLLAIFVMSCSDDDDFGGPYRITIDGPVEVTAADTETYSIGDIADPGSYSWSVEGPASIDGGASGGEVMIDFTGVGEVIITVGNGTDTGYLVVHSVEVEPEVMVILNGGGALREGETDTVFFEFGAPLMDNPAFAMNTDTSGFNYPDLAFTSGVLGDLVKVDDDTYYALYTAGEGNGTPEALFQDVQSSSEFGGVSFDSAYVQLYRVDNIAPVADISYSDTRVNDSTVITITVTFSEVVEAANPASDSSILISFDGAGVMSETDTLMPTGNMNEYMYEYTVNGEGNGNLEITIDNFADIAGNTNIIYSEEVIIDNIPPTIVYEVDGDTGAATIYLAVGNFGDFQEGTGWYAVFPDGADAPTTLDDFEDAIATGSKEMQTEGYAIFNVALAAGEYDVYLIGSDMAGNMSSIAMEDVTID